MKYYSYFIQHQNNAGSLAAAFAAASITGQESQKNAASSLRNAARVKQLTTGQAARLILSPFNKHLLFAGLFIKETKKAAETALKSVINNNPASAGPFGLIWPMTESSSRQASQQPASSPATTSRQGVAARGTGTTARKSLKVAESRSKSLAQKVAAKVAKSPGSQSR